MIKTNSKNKLPKGLTGLKEIKNPLTTISNI